MKLKENFNETDVRNSFQAKPKTIDDYYEWMDRAQLNECIPENIFKAFETARNIFLYS